MNTNEQIAKIDGLMLSASGWAVLALLVLFVAAALNAPLVSAPLAVGAAFCAVKAVAKTVAACKV